MREVVKGKNNRKKKCELRTDYGRMGEKKEGKEKICMYTYYSSL